MAKKLRIDLEELRMARDDHSGQQSWVLDTETGEVIPLAEGGNDLPFSIEEIDQDETGRFLEIEPADSRKDYADMEEFLATVTDAKLRDRLAAAIASKGVFRRFKDAIASDPRERERWFRFQAERANGRIRAWLADNEIE